MKNYLLLALGLILTSCGTMTRVSSTGEVTIQQGFASSIQQSTVTVTPNGPGKYPTIVAIQTGYDGTSVINNITGAVVTGLTLAEAQKLVQSNNHLSIVKARQPTIQNGQNINGNVSEFNAAVKGGAVPTVGTVTPVP